MTTVAKHIMCNYLTVLVTDGHFKTENTERATVYLS